LKHRATKAFWKLYNDLTPHVQRQALKQYRLLKGNPQHPSVRFKPVSKLWSARVNDDYRALAIKRQDAYVWFWIGPHQDYDKILAKS
jgi:hypothetical protein